MRGYQKRFELKVCSGNNLFSLQERKQKKISIPHLVSKDVLALRQGSEIAFCEYEDEVEVLCPGVFEIIHDEKRNIYLFDNHNHSFYFIYLQYLKGDLPSTLMHVDQHKDSRRPILYFENFCILMQEEVGYDDAHRFFTEDVSKTLFEKNGWQDILWRESLMSGAFSFSVNLSHRSEIKLLEQEERMEYLAWLYTNYVLNVGNFIPPIYKSAQFDRYNCIDSAYKIEEMEREKPGSFVLDLDLDFFSSDMDYIPWEKKIDFVKRLLEEAKLVTIATSPFFIEFERCEQVLKSLFF